MTSGLRTARTLATLACFALPMLACEATLQLGEPDDAMTNVGAADTWADPAPPDALDAPDGTGGDDAGPPDSSLSLAPNADGTTLGDPNDTSAKAVGQDVTTVDPCQDVTCGAHARCDDGSCVCDGGFVNEGGNCVAADSCWDVTCGANAHCDGGGCVCDGGFVEVVGACLPQEACQGVTCDVNAHCDGGGCVCDGGFVNVGGNCVAADACQGVTCGGNAHCDGGGCVCDGGFVDLGGSCVAANLCQGVTCGVHAHCDGGGCVCDGGFVDVGGSCVTPDISVPALRTKAQVCDRWLADWPTRSTSFYDPGVGLAACDPGVINPVAHDDAMRRLNLYRWLLGLDPAGVDWAHQAKAQAAALMMHANSALNHAPPSSWTCWTQDGFAAASASNLALGITSPAATVDAYIQENGVPSMGHRRWCFSPGLDGVGFGHYERGGVMWALGEGVHSEPDFIAYPSPGPFPIDGIHGDWSFHRAQAFSSPVVSVTRVSDDVSLNINATIRGGGNYGRIATIGIAVNDPVVAGETYRVDIADGGSMWSYETRIVDCSRP